MAERNYLKYSFLKVSPEWRRRSDEERAQDKREFAAACNEFATDHYLRAYSLVGTRGDCDLMIRAVAASLDPIHELHVLLNQAGSFVPAAKARLGICDRIFTRVGASDQLARGESTFMVEMHETANILNNATDRSLIILDEVGRGTATFDGLSLAWAIIEFLHDNPARSGITLFATHYHEVTDLAKTKPRVANSNVAVKEWNEQIIFLRKVVEGSADKSYGIQVAKLAGIPQSVIERAREILDTLERKERDVVEETRRRGPTPPTRQLGLFNSTEQSIIDALRTIDIDALSPRDALNALYELRKKLE